MPYDALQVGKYFSQHPKVNDAYSPIIVSHLDSWFSPSFTIKTSQENGVVGMLRTILLSISVYVSMLLSFCFVSVIREVPSGGSGLCAY